MRRGRLLSIALVASVVLGTAVAVASCANPVESDLVDSLGPEKAGVPPGPFHRPGQPCLACHSDGGQGSPVLSAGGTVFATPTEDVPVGNVDVTITDSSGRKVDMLSNCAGNFYATETLAQLAFPLHVEIECTLPDGSKRRSVMGTRVERDGSCASCHSGNPSASSPGRVACATDEPTPPFTPGCGGGT